LYIGFGGPFLEDFRLLSNVFPNLDMVSVESDGETYRRQKFHQCSKKVKLLSCRFEEFLSTLFPSEKPTIVWVDYVDAGRQELTEVSGIARQALEWSVLRVTLMAETPVYREVKLRRHQQILPSYKKKDFNEFRDDYLKAMTVAEVSYDHDLFTWENFKEENFPWLLSHMVLSVLESACSKPKTFLPLQVAKYSDGTIMLSITGVFCPENNRDALLGHFKATSPLYVTASGLIDEIDVPVLSTKERLKLEEILPTETGDGTVCVTALGYLTEGDDSEEVSIAKMSNYERYSRLYPYFARMVP